MKASVPMSRVRYLLKAVEGQGLDRQSVLDSLELNLLGDLDFCEGDSTKLDIGISLLGVGYSKFQFFKLTTFDSKPPCE